MNQFQIVRTIAASPEAVFALLTDVEKTPLWSPAISEATITSPGPLAEGSTITYVGRFLGRRFTSTSAVTEIRPPIRYAAKSTSGPFDLTISNALEKDDDGTRLVSDFAGDSRGFFKLAESVVVRASKRLFEANMDLLKELLEAGEEIPT
ncbi:MAG: SRPBCC family protein [Acidimicrobiales bacterium]